MGSKLTTSLPILCLGKFTLGTLTDSVPRSQWGHITVPIRGLACLCFSQVPELSPHLVIYSPPCQAQCFHLKKKTQKPKPSTNGHRQ